MTAEHSYREKDQHDADSAKGLPSRETPSLEKQPSVPPPNPSRAISVPPANFGELLGRAPSTSPDRRIRRVHKEFCVWNPADSKVLGTPFALHVKTTKIVAHEVPEYILGAAADE